MSDRTFCFGIVDDCPAVALILFPSPFSSRLCRNMTYRSATCMSPEIGLLETVSPRGGTRLPEESVLTLNERKLVHVLINILAYSLRSDRDVHRVWIPHPLEQDCLVR